ncbi:MAG: SulP family inorganic anion transporter [Ferruginibacter sp.]
MFVPKLFYTLKNYSREQFFKDLLAGLIVGIVALPLSIAFAIASGVSPEKGLFTAVIAGFIISALGGSRVQIGGPTGAFIVIVYGIVQQYGVNGLIIATLIAGVMLILMGIARLGVFIKFIPHPLIVGFTSGIAVIIFSSQLKDLFGLQMESMPADFIEKWAAYFTSFHTIDIYATALGLGSVVIIVLWPKVTHVIPGSLIAIIFCTVLVQVLHLPVETIGSRFGSIPSTLPMPTLPHLDYATIKNLIQPAFTIALLCAIESLLSAVVSDGMIGSTHRSNMELVAQGLANIGSSLFGGIPATGAIARTATNVKNGGRTPIAGIVHAIVLLLIMLFVGKWAALIPMATLAGILVVVAYNMSEWHSFINVLKGPKSDIAILITTFLLTVLIDLTVAIEIGMVLSVFLFMRTMMKSSNVNNLTNALNESAADETALGSEKFVIPKGVEVFEISGPLFFGAAYKFKDAMRFIEKPPKVLIIRMRKVPVIDATGIRILDDVYKQSKAKGTKMMLAEIESPQILEELRKARVLFAIGKGNVLDTMDKALARAQVFL